MDTPQKFTSIAALHSLLGFPAPLHPLVSLVNYADIRCAPDELPGTLLLDFYKISFKKNLSGKIRYGQHYYDFAEGGLSFFAPHQLIASGGQEEDYEGYTLLIHPDFLRGHPLEAQIRKSGFFSYAVSEALFLSGKEQQVVTAIFENIRGELNSNIDSYSHDIILSHIGLLLSYSNRFYQRQFITRRVVNHDLLTRMETLLEEYFGDDPASQRQLLTVEYLAGQLHLSPKYLSDMLRSLTGLNAQQHIHQKLIDKAKAFLRGSNLTVAEIAFRLGFERAQSFNRLFKQKTNLTPVEYRRSAN